MIVVGYLSRAGNSMAFSRRKYDKRMRKKATKKSWKKMSKKERDAAVIYFLRWAENLDANLVKEIIVDNKE
jgi:hypothetical protein